MSLLEGDLAQIIGDALTGADLTYELVIPRTTREPRPPDWPTWQHWEGETVTVHHSCQGFVDTYSEFLIASGVVQAGDVKIVIVQTTLQIEPKLTDVIIARGKTYTIIDMSEDPARATLEVKARA